MEVDWEAFLSRLRSYPKGVHKILPPYTGARLEAIQKQLGILPRALSEMLCHINGAELFIAGTPLVTVFGISSTPPLPPLDWAEDWYIDKFTPTWRRAGNRQLDWTIAMTNYGGLIVLDEHCSVKEFDTSQSTLTPRNTTLDQWLSKVMQEGDASLQR